MISFMEKDNTFSKMAIDIKENPLEEKELVMEFTTILMVIGMRDNFYTVRSIVTGFTTLTTVIDMRVSLRMISFMAKALTIVRMETMRHGKMVKKLESVLYFDLMGERFNYIKLTSVVQK